MPGNLSSASMWNATIGHSWLTMILPQIEQPAVYNSIGFGLGISANGGTNPTTGLYYNNLIAATTPIATFQCPSDNSHGQRL